MRDGRKIWIDGEWIADVTADRRLGRGVRSIAALHDLQLPRSAAMIYVASTSGARVGLSHIQPRSIDNLVRRRNMIKTFVAARAGADSGGVFCP